MIEFNIEAKQLNPVIEVLGTDIYLMFKEVTMAGASLVDPAWKKKQIIGKVHASYDLGWGKVYHALLTEGFKEDHESIDEITKMVKGDVEIYFTHHYPSWISLLQWNSLVLTVPQGQHYSEIIFKIVICNYNVKSVDGVHFFNPPLPEPESEPEMEI